MKTHTFTIYAKGVPIQIILVNTGIRCKHFRKEGGAVLFFTKFIDIVSS
jgi:hypothetical protein